MRKKAGILSLSAVGLALLLSSCQYTKDPNQEWKDRALNAYKLFYSKAENQNLSKDPLFYFDPETFKGVLVRSETDVTYLGQLNFSNFSFSENPNKYFVDFGNVPITFNDTNNDGEPDNFTFGNYIRQDESGNTVFDVEELFDNLPFVLHEDNFGKEPVKTFSMVNDEGVVEDTSNALAYDPNFFYISDFSLKISGAEDLTGDILNFEGKDLCFLRNDLYEIMDSLLSQEDIKNINEALGLTGALRNTYRRSVGIPLDQNMPTEITIKGDHYTNFSDKREVVVGPISYIPTLLSHYLPDIGATDFEPSIYDVNTVRIEEGIKTIGFYSFYGERDSETGASKSNLKNVYLPSTLEDIQFNAFSNLDLENIYIPKTYTEVDGNKVQKSFETVDFGEATIALDEGNENSLELDITPSFGNTSIQNIYFEDYNNTNIQTFPYSTINFASTEARNSAVKIYHGEEDVTKFETLSEALNTYESVNPFYQMVLTADQEKNKYTINSDIDSIAKGKKLYLPYFEYSLSTSEARSIVRATNNSNLLDEVTPENAKLTLKLTRDLVIEGDLIVGAQIGRNKLGSGDINGEFSAIDLNGHKITIKNGASLLGNGLIFDSTNNGEIVVENGGTLSTNFVVTDYQDFASLQNRAESGANLFDSYKFNSLKVKTTFNSGSKLLANLAYAAQNLVNTSSFEYIGNSDTSLLKLENGNLVLNSSSLSGVGSKVSINNVNLLEIQDLGSINQSSEIFTSNKNGFNLAYDGFNVSLNEVILNTYLRCESGSLSVASLTLNNEAKLYSKEASNFNLLASLNVNENVTNAWILGDIKTNEDTSFNSVLNFVKGLNKAKLSYSNNVSEFNLNTNSTSRSVKNLRAIKGENRESFDKLLFKNQVSSYYLYENNFTSGALYGNDDSEGPLASFNGVDDTWIANINVDGHEKVVDTNVSSKTSRTINSFMSLDQSVTYVLNTSESCWKEFSNADEKNGIYHFGSNYYIKTDSNSPLIEGSVLEESSPLKDSQPIFIADEDNSLYFRSDLSKPDSWVKVTSFDGGYTLKEASNNTYYSLINGNEYTKGVSYDESKHLVTSNDVHYAFTGKKYTELTSDQKVLDNTIVGEDKTGYVLLASLGKWEEVGLIGENVANGLEIGEESQKPIKYYFKVNNTWLSSVDGSSYAFTYNELANYSFGVLNSRYSYGGQRYKFIMKEGDDSLENDKAFELFAPQGLVNVSKEDFSDMWPENATEDNFHAYRHIEKDGEKYLFFMNEKNEIKLRHFEYATGFTPSDPNPDSDNPLTKYNFIIYKVNFYLEDGSLDPNVTTIYVNVDSSNDDNAIYAGNSEDTNSDDYLALAVFTLTNPISSLNSSSN